MSRNKGSNGKGSLIRTLLVTACIFALYKVVTGGHWLLAVITVLIMILCLIKREQIISEEGAGARYSIFSIGVKKLWSWSEVTAIEVDRKKAAPNVIIRIRKGASERAFTMSADDSKTVIDFIRNKNPKLFAGKGKKKI